MLLKILMCTADSNYAGRFDAYFDREYSDKTEVNIFDTVQDLNIFLLRFDADIVLVGEEFLQDIKTIEGSFHGTIAVLTQDTYELKEIDCPCIAKYQRADALYKKIVDIYAQSDRVKIANHDKMGSKGKIYAFMAASGGVGTTTLAIAFARKCAVSEKVLFLNFDFIPDGASEHHGMQDIIIALKSRRNILPYKLVSAVMADSYQVETYGSCANPLDILEINGNDMSRLLEEIRNSCDYDRVIIDIGNHIDQKGISALKLADDVICVANHMEKYKNKMAKMAEVFAILEKRENIRIMRKMTLLLNKSGRNHLADWEDIKAKSILCIPESSQQEQEALINKIAAAEAFDSLL